MPELSQDAVHELRQSLPVLGMLRELFTRPDLQTGDELRQLIRAYNRISELTSSAEVETWVGDLLIDVLEDTQRHQDWEDWRTDGEIMHIAWTLSQRLHTYVQTRLDSEKIREALDRLTQENTSLEEQVAELRQQEQTYSSLLSEAQTVASYEVPPESVQILFHSKQRQHTILTKRLARLQETKAQYGPDTRPHVLEDIDQTQEQIRQIEAEITDWESKIEWV